MNKIKDNISFLKNIIHKRETYIRFSPVWTAIMWFMFIAYYFFWENVCSMYIGSRSYECMNSNLFLLIWVIWVIAVTILSLFNSENKWEDLFPQSIRYVILNLITVSIAFLIIIWKISPTMIELVIPIAFLLFGLLIIVSRLSIPKYIKYFWFVVFISWMLLMWPMSNYINEIILIVLWFWHLLMAILLKLNNEKDE